MRVRDLLAQYKEYGLTAPKVRAACKKLGIDPDEIDDRDAERLLAFIAKPKQTSRESLDSHASDSSSSLATADLSRHLAQVFTQGCSTGEAQAQEAVALLNQAFDLGRTKAYQATVAVALDEIAEKYDVPTGTYRHRLSDGKLLALLPPGIVADYFGDADTTIDVDSFDA